MCIYIYCPYTYNNIVASYSSWTGNANFSAYLNPTRSLPFDPFTYSLFIIIFFPIIFLWFIKIHQRVNEITFNSKNKWVNFFYITSLHRLEFKKSKSKKNLISNFFEMFLSLKWLGIIIDLKYKITRVEKKNKINTNDLLDDNNTTCNIFEEIFYIKLKCTPSISWSIKFPLIIKLMLRFTFHSSKKKKNK